MSYDSLETSVESGRPVELYEIVVGTQTFRYTSAEDEQPIGAVTYEPKPISRGKVEEGPQRRNADFVVKLPTSDPLSQLFLGVLPGVRVPIVVRRFHRGDTSVMGGPEVVITFSGFVLSANFAKNGKECRLTARHALASLNRIIPARSFMSSCNHVLYHATTCRADDTSPANRVSAAPVVSQVATALTVTGLSGTFPDGTFDSGFVEAVGTSDFRLVLSHAGDVLTLLTPFTTTPATVNVFRGCPHTIAACKTDFDNVINFGGFAFVPNRNPYVGTIE